MGLATSKFVFLFLILQNYIYIKLKLSINLDWPRDVLFEFIKIWEIVKNKTKKAGLRKRILRINQMRKKLHRLAE